jgi:aerobic carbon-monoxide dehydrogenase medium subunit
MYPASIEQYHRPATVDEARAAYAAAGGEAMYIAGGMSLMQAMKSRVLSCRALIDLNQVSELRGVDNSGGRVRIGAMTRYRAVAEARAALGPYQALADAADRVGDRQVRNRGTVGGSLSWNFVVACTPVAALACGASVSILRSDGRRESVAIDDFLQGPMTTALGEGDLLLGIEMPIPANPASSAYRKWGVVVDALPTIGVAVFVELASGSSCRNARIAVVGLPGGPARTPRAEALLKAASLDDPSALAACARTAAEECEPAADPWVGVSYKSHLIERLCLEMIGTAAARARSQMS